MPAFKNSRYRAAFAVYLAILVNLMEACVFGTILFLATFRDATVRGGRGGRRAGGGGL